MTKHKYKHIGRIIEQSQKRKAQSRRDKSIRIMKSRKPVDCKKCIHGVTKSCTSDLPRGCEHFYKVA